MCQKIGSIHGVDGNTDLFDLSDNEDSDDSGDHDNDGSDKAATNARADSLDNAPPGVKVLLKGLQRAKKANQQRQRKAPKSTTRKKSVGASSTKPSQSAQRIRAQPAVLRPSGRTSKRRTTDTLSPRQEFDRATSLTEEARRLKAQGLKLVDEDQIGPALQAFAAAVRKLEQVDPELIDRSKAVHVDDADPLERSSSSATNAQPTSSRSQLDVGNLRGSLHDMRAQLLMAAKQDFRACQEAELAVLCSSKEWVFHQTLARARLNLGEVRYVPRLVLACPEFRLWALRQSLSSYVVRA